MSAAHAVTRRARTPGRECRSACRRGALTNIGTSTIALPRRMMTRLCHQFMPGRDHRRGEHVGRDADADADPQRREVPEPPGALRERRGREVRVRKRVLVGGRHPLGVHAGRDCTWLLNVASRGYNDVMRTAGVREVKDRLSEFLRLVKSGEQVLITDRGEVVAMLGPPGPAFEQAEFPRLEQMIREGRATRGCPEAPGNLRAHHGARESLARTSSGCSTKSAPTRGPFPARDELSLRRRERHPHLALARATGRRGGFDSRGSERGLLLGAHARRVRSGPPSSRQRRPLDRSQARGAGGSSRVCGGELDPDRDHPIDPDTCPAPLRQHLRPHARCHSPGNCSRG